MGAGWANVQDSALAWVSVNATVQELVRPEALASVWAKEWAWA